MRQRKEGVCSQRDGLDRPLKQSSPIQRRDWSLRELMHRCELAMSFVAFLFQRMGGGQSCSQQRYLGNRFHSLELKLFVFFCTDYAINTYFGNTSRKEGNCMQKETIDILGYQTLHPVCNLLPLYMYDDNAKQCEAHIARIGGKFTTTCCSMASKVDMPTPRAM